MPFAVNLRLVRLMTCLLPWVGYISGCGLIIGQKETPLKILKFTSNPDVVLSGTHFIKVDSLIERNGCGTEYVFRQRIDRFSKTYYVSAWSYDPIKLIGRGCEGPQEGESPIEATLTLHVAEEGIYTIKDENGGLSTKVNVKFNMPEIL